MILYIFFIWKAFLHVKFTDNCVRSMGKKTSKKNWNVCYWAEQFVKGRIMNNSLEWLKNILQKGQRVICCRDI